ncbi:MAG: response regulator [Deltaproteobacteria bacterium]|nr:response regulator [Deltaproteobacteria bacterium]
MREIKVLVVDDEERFLTSISKLLTKRDCQVSTASSGQRALGVLKEKFVDVMVLDLKMPGLDGIGTLKEAKKLSPTVEIIMLTGHGTVDTAVEAIQLGAFDYLMKPCSLEELFEKIKEAADRKWIIEDKIRKEGDK